MSIGAGFLREAERLRGALAGMDRRATLATTDEDVADRMVIESALRRAEERIADAEEAERQLAAERQAAAMAERERQAAELTEERMSAEEARLRAFQQVEERTELLIAACAEARAAGFRMAAAAQNGGDSMEAGRLRADVSNRIRGYVLHRLDRADIASGILPAVGRTERLTDRR